MTGGILNAASCAFEENYAARGGAISLRGGSVTVSDSTFLSNWATESGGGIDARGDVTFDVSTSHFVANGADGHGAGVYFDRGFAPTTPSVSPTVGANFSANRGLTVLLALQPLSLRCEPGQWTTAALDHTASDLPDDFTGCPYSCARGYIGLYANHTGPTCGGECPRGMYCGRGSSAPCPVGTANGESGAGRIEACLSCSPGTFQAAEGSTACASCQPGSTVDVVGQTSCAACKAGGYCALTSSGTTTRTLWEPCPAGAWSNLTGRADSSDCRACPTSHCERYVGPQILCRRLALNCISSRPDGAP